MFRRKAALGLSFRTEKPDGLLLFRAPSNMSNNEVDEDDGDDKHYLALVMVAGEVLPPFLTLKNILSAVNFNKTKPMILCHR